MMPSGRNGKHMLERVPNSGRRVRSSSVSAPPDPHPMVLNTISAGRASVISLNSFLLMPENPRSAVTQPFIAPEAFAEPLALAIPARLRPTDQQAVDATSN